VPSRDPLRDAITRIANRQTDQAQKTGEQFDALAERVESAIARLDNRLSARLDFMDQGTQRALDEARIAIGELRDRLHRVEETAGRAVDVAHDAAAASRVAAEKSDIAAERSDVAANATRAGMNAAVGAMRNTQEIMQATPKATAGLFWSSTTGRVVKICSVIAGVGAAVTAVPSIARFFYHIGEALFQALVSNPPPPIPPGAMG
jgi:ABC-type transporter Mla subunit MlaD